MKIRVSSFALAAVLTCFLVGTARAQSTPFSTLSLTVQGGKDSAGKPVTTTIAIDDSGNYKLTTTLKVLWPPDAPSQDSQGQLGDQLAVLQSDFTSMTASNPPATLPLMGKGAAGCPTFSISYTDASGKTGQISGDMSGSDDAAAWQAVSPVLFELFQRFTLEQQMAAPLQVSVAGVPDSDANSVDGDVHLSHLKPVGPRTAGDQAYFPLTIKSSDSDSLKKVNDAYTNKSYVTVSGLMVGWSIDVRSVTPGTVAVTGSVSGSKDSGFTLTSATPTSVLGQPTTTFKLTASDALLSQLETAAAQGSGASVTVQGTLAGADNIQDPRGVMVPTAILVTSVAPATTGTGDSGATTTTTTTGSSPASGPTPGFVGVLGAK